MEHLCHNERHHHDPTAKASAARQTIQTVMYVTTHAAQEAHRVFKILPVFCKHQPHLTVMYVTTYAAQEPHMCEDLAIPFA